MLLWPLVPVVIGLFDVPAGVLIVLNSLATLIGGLGAYAGLCFLVFASAAVAYRKIPGGFPVSTSSCWAPGSSATVCRRCSPLVLTPGSPRPTRSSRPPC